MATRDKRIDEYIAKAAPFARPILRHLRAIVHAGCPDVQETLKWSMPHFEHHGILCGMAAFKQHCAFGFWKGSLLEGIGANASDAMGQFGRLESLEDLPNDRTLTRLVRRAAALNDQRVKAPTRKTGPNRPARLPSDLRSALKRNRRALRTFEDFPPSARREYIDWITEAKRDETHRRRVETAVEWLAGGKPRNWKYLKPDA